jgi:hypothetical protein
MQWSFNLKGKNSLMKSLGDFFSTDIVIINRTFKFCSEGAKLKLK